MYTVTPKRIQIKYLDQTVFYFGFQISNSVIGN